MYRNLTCLTCKSLCDIPIHLLSQNILFTKAIITLKTVQLRNKVFFPPLNTLMLQPWVSFYRSFTAVTIVIKKFFSFLDVSGGHKDKVRYSINIMEFGLTIAIFTVVDEPSQSIRLLRSVHTVGEEMCKISDSVSLLIKEIVQPKMKNC